MEKIGKLTTHASHEATSFVVQLQKLNFARLYQREPIDECINELSMQLNQTRTDFNQELAKLSNACKAIVLSKIQFKSAQLCKIFKLNVTRCLKSIIFITGAAALATASTALDLSIQNEKQIKEIRETPERHESKLGHMRF